MMLARLRKLRKRERFKREGTGRRETPGVESVF